MSQKEQELIDIICNDKDPAYALAIAIEIIFDVAAQPEASQLPHPSYSLAAL